MNRTVLVTGGAGYIGSHVALDLLRAGDDVVIVDNLDNSSPAAVDAVGRLAGRQPVFVRADLRDTERLAAVFAEHPIQAVVHLAGLKAVGESVSQPLRYYRVNLDSTLTLLEQMTEAGVHDLVFSSSATVYGEPERVPITESAPIGATNPYGRTKVVIEQMLRDLTETDRRWRVASLRYFNPVGNDPSGELGEDPRGIPNNLMPRLMEVAVGRMPAVTVFGDDYPTPDGTGVRDYVHVSDLARGHRVALDRLDDLPGWFPVNLGAGSGYSVREMITAVERAVGRPLPVEVHPRRPGDATTVIADPSLAGERLEWKTDRGLDAICVDTWAWRQRHPEGFGT